MGRPPQGPSGARGEVLHQERLVYIPRERPCSLFSGTGEINVQVWIEEIKSVMRMRRLSLADQAHYIYDHLVGDAREEIKYRSQAVREDPDTIFDILLNQYGCPMSFIATKEAFYARKQQEGESLREYSHSLFSLMDKMIQSCPDRHIPDAVRLLRDQFVEGVGDGGLSRELKRIVGQHPDYDLHTVRDEALRWERDGRVGAEQSRFRSQSVPSVYSIQHTGRAQVDKVGTELAELKEMLKQQQAQIDQLTQELKSGRSFATPRFTQKRGQFICRRCQKPGHFARDCDNERVGPGQRSTDLHPSSQPGN